MVPSMLFRASTCLLFLALFFALAYSIPDPQQLRLGAFIFHFLRFFFMPIALDFQLLFFFFFFFCFFTCLGLLYFQCVLLCSLLWLWQCSSILAFFCPPPLEQGVYRFCFWECYGLVHGKSFFGNELLNDTFYDRNSKFKLLG